MGSNNRHRTGLALLLGGLLVTAGLVAEDARAAGGEGLKVGTVAPTFMLPVVNSYKETARRWGPAKWTGRAKEKKKLVIMSFFATYCEPCKKEMPELVRLYNEYEDQGLGVMLVSIDKGSEQRDVVVELAEKNKVPFPVLHDRFQVVARRYDAERLPYMLMLGPDGVVKTVHIGYTDELKAGLENEVRASLGMEPLATEEVAAKEPEKAESNKPKKGKAGKKPGKKPAKKSGKKGAASKDKTAAKG